MWSEVGVMHLRTGLLVALTALAIALALWPGTTSATATLTLAGSTVAHREALLAEFEGPDVTKQVRRAMDLPADVTFEVRATAPQASSPGALADVTAASQDPRLAADLADTAAVLAASETGLTPMLEPAAPEPVGPFSRQFWALLTATVAVGMVFALTRSTSAKTG